MKLTLKVWRQESGAEDGHFVEYPLEDVGPEFSLLEALDKLNDNSWHAVRTPWRSTRTAVRASAVRAG